MVQLNVAAAKHGKTKEKAKMRQKQRDDAFHDRWSFRGESSEEGQVCEWAGGNAPWNFDTPRESKKEKKRDGSQKRFFDLLSVRCVSVGNC